MGRLRLGLSVTQPDSINPGVWPIFIVDNLPDGEAGVHLTDHLQPYALVLAGDTWSLSASHECLEMLVDPSGNWLISSSAVQVVNGEIQDLGSEKYEYLVEVADPSEDPSNAYMVNDVLVSDFYTPRYFDPVAVASGVRYSFSGKITRPRQVLPGGYLSWVNPQTARCSNSSTTSSRRSSISRRLHRPRTDPRCAVVSMPSAHLRRGSPASRRPRTRRAQGCAVSVARERGRTKVVLLCPRLAVRIPPNPPTATMTCWR